MTVTYIKPNVMPLIPEDEPPSKFTRFCNSWIMRTLVYPLLNLPVRFYFWSRLNWILPVIALIAMLWVVSYVTLTDWWTKQIFISKVNIVKVAKAAELPEVPKVEAIKPSYSIKQVVDAVHILESSGGKNDGCKKKGLINGYGYAQHGSGKVWTCFDSHTEVRALVEKWYAKRIPELGLSTALCYYNTGYKLQECPYYQNFLKVVK